MIFFQGSLIGIFVAIVASIILGFVWYGPLFGKTWMQLMSISKKEMERAKQKGMTGTYVIMVINTIVMVCVFSLFLNEIGNVGWQTGAMVGFLAWLGFVATITLGSVLWESKSWSLWMFNNAYNLINYILVGIILGSLN